MRNTLTTTAALAALLLTIGCGDGGGSGSAAGPSAAQADAAQKGEAAGDAANQTMSLSTEAIADSGSNGAVASKGVPSAGKTTVHSFNYQAAINVTLDLDEKDAQNNDKWPNASGKLNIIADGTLTGDSTSGTATYDVQTNWITPGVFTDPVSGVVATMGIGSGLQYTATVTWSWSAQDTWTVTATSHLSGNHTLTVVDAGVTYTATASGFRDATVTFSQTPAGFSLTWNVSGERTVTVTNGVETHVIVVVMTNPNHITISVDGTVFGPYTAWQIRHYFGCQMD
jgi:hypothetical protein